MDQTQPPGRRLVTVAVGCRAAGHELGAVCLNGSTRSTSRCLALLALLQSSGKTLGPLSHSHASLEDVFVQPHRPAPARGRGCPYNVTPSNKDAPADTLYSPAVGNLNAQPRARFLRANTTANHKPSSGCTAFPLLIAGRPRCRLPQQTVGKSMSTFSRPRWRTPGAAELKKSDQSFEVGRPRGPRLPPEPSTMAGPISSSWLRQNSRRSTHTSSTGLTRIAPRASNDPQCRRQLSAAASRIPDAPEVTDKPPENTGQLQNNQLSDPRPDRHEPDGLAACGVSLRDRRYYARSANC